MTQWEIDQRVRYGDPDPQPPATCRDCDLCWHGEQPYELVGNEELRGELVDGWGICLADTCPRLVELDGGGCA